MRGDGEELLTRVERVLGPLVQARILDGERGAAGQLLGQLQVMLRVLAVRWRTERDGTDEPALHHQWHAQVRDGLQAIDDGVPGEDGGVNVRRDGGALVSRYRDQAARPPLTEEIDRAAVAQI